MVGRDIHIRREWTSQQHSRNRQSAIPACKHTNTPLKANSKQQRGRSSSISCTLYLHLNFEKSTSCPGALNLAPSSWESLSPYRKPWWLLVAMASKGRGFMYSRYSLHWESKGTVGLLVVCVSVSLLVITNLVCTSRVTFSVDLNYIQLILCIFLWSLTLAELWLI